MINIIILAVMIITLMGGAAYGLVSVAHGLQTGIENLAVEDRLEEAAQGIAANIVSISSSSGKTYYVPAPDTLSMPTVPSWITPNAQTPRGVKFLYCPFSNVTGGTTAITTPNGSYNVTISTSFSGNNISSNNYVTQSTAPPSNEPYALAIIVAPGPKQSALLSTQDCLSVSATGTLPGASVRVITAQEVQSRAQVTASYGNEFYAASSASGDGRGTSQSNYATFSTIMDYINKYRPQRTTINLKPNNTISVASSDVDQTTVTTREFSAIRNQSINFNGFFGGGYTSNLEAASNVTQPIQILGSVGFDSVLFPAVNNTLLRPAADMFGNAINFTSITNGGNGYTSFGTADNGGKFITGYAFTEEQAAQYMSNWGGNSMGTPPNNIYTPNIASSPTGNEMDYAQRGGAIVNETGAGLTSTTNYSSYVFYNDFGGKTIISSGDPANDSYWNYFYLSHGNSSVAPVYVAGAGNLFGPTSFYDIDGGSSDTVPYTLYGDLGSRIATGGIEFADQSGAYIQGGLFYASNLVASHSNSYNLLMGPGSNAIIPQMSGSRPTVAAVLINSFNGQYEGATFVATGPIYGTNNNTSTTQCLADMSSYNLGSDAGNVAGASLAPQGSIGKEATIILNRSNGNCE